MNMLSLAFEDFILSREASLCSPETIDFYRRMLKPFLTLANGTAPSKRMVREFLSTVARRGILYRPRARQGGAGLCTVCL